MTTLIATSRSGREHIIPAAPGSTLMEIIRDAGLDELLALCGGCCSCATCHVYVDPSHAALLPSMDGDESDLLDGSEHRTPASRLACQLVFETQMDGLRIAIAPED